MKKTMFLMLSAGILLSSCASKKELASCQTENKSLSEKLSQTREDLAAKNARVTSLEEQLAAQKYALAEQKKIVASL